MPRPSDKEEVEICLRTYLAHAETQPPNMYPLNVKAVAKAIKVSRTSLYNYGLTHLINEARQRQETLAKERGDKRTRRTLDEIIQHLQAEVSKLREQIGNLREERLTIQENAKLLGVEIDLLLRPLSKPNRSVPHTGSGGKKRNNQ